MKYRLIAYALSALIRALPPDTVKRFLDDLLDRIEDGFDDDVLIMKTVGYVRELLSIPDYPDD